MTIKKWTTELDGIEHSFRFEHQFWTGRKEYYVDDTLVRKVSGGLFESGSFGDKADFTLGSHTGLFEYSAKVPLQNALLPGSIFFEHNGIISKCGLSIDGENIQGTSEKAPHYPPWINWAFAVFILGLIVVLRV
ncbi:MAG: hypothetical protein ACU85U_14070 [Gammaproteobacteria bacterium]